MSDRVSIRDIYDQIEKLDRKLDSRFVKIEDDIEDLKNFKSTVLGIGSVAVIFLSGFATWVWRKLTGE